MQGFYPLLFGFLLLCGITKIEHADAKVVATCDGDAPCTACTSCSSCKDCKAVGTCGVGAVVKKKTTKPVTKTVPHKSTRCQPSLKKGQDIPAPADQIVIAGSMVADF